MKTRTAPITRRREAYSYVRFSTAEQAKGDSKRRQTTMAAEYAKLNNLDLNDTLTFRDEGVSSFRGKNSETGKLAEFLEAVRKGIVPQGSVLLVENFDRISRQAARKALRTIEEIVESGVSLVTLTDGKEYDEAALDDSMNFMIAMITLMRGNESGETLDCFHFDEAEIKWVFVGGRPNDRLLHHQNNVFAVHNLTSTALQQTTTQL